MKSQKNSSGKKANTIHIDPDKQLQQKEPYSESMHLFLINWWMPPESSTGGSGSVENAHDN